MNKARPLLKTNPTRIWKFHLFAQKTFLSRQRNGIVNTMPVIYSLKHTKRASRADNLNVSNMAKSSAIIAHFFTRGEIAMSEPNTILKDSPDFRKASLNFKYAFWRLL